MDVKEHKALRACHLIQPLLALEIAVAGADARGRAHKHLVLLAQLVKGPLKLGGHGVALGLSERGSRVGRAAGSTALKDKCDGKPCFAVLSYHAFSVGLHTCQAVPLASMMKTPLLLLAACLVALPLRRAAEAGAVLTGDDQARPGVQARGAGTFHPAGWARRRVGRAEGGERAPSTPACRSFSSKPQVPPLNTATSGSWNATLVGDRMEWTLEVGGQPAGRRGPSLSCSGL